MMKNITRRIFPAVMAFLLLVSVLCGCKKETATKPAAEEPKPYSAVVTFRDGESEKTQTFTEILSLDKNEFSREGFLFDGWNTEEDGTGESYYNMQRVKPDGDTVLYAQWKKAPYAATVGGLVASGITPFDYDDSFFDAPSTAENKSLASSLAVAATAAYSKEAADLLFSELGYTVLWQDYAEATAENSDISAYTVAKKAVGYSTYYAVVIRGTFGKYEWVSNFDTGIGTEHKGFSAAADTIYNRLMPLLSGFDSAKDKLWITGHSRGAAVANLLGAKINEAAALPTESVFVYTYATPNTTKLPVAYENIYNYIIGGDIAGAVPPSGWGFSKHGKTFTLETEGALYTEFRTLFRAYTGKKYQGETSESAELLSEYLTKIVPTAADCYIENKYGFVPVELFGRLIDSLANGELPEDIGISGDALNDATIKKLLALASKYTGEAAGHAHTPESYIIMARMLESEQDNK